MRPILERLAILFSLTAVLLLSDAALAQPEPGIIRLPAVDVTQLERADRTPGREGKPLRYASAHRVSGISLSNGVSSGAQWRRLNDGRWSWQLEIQASGALTLDVGLTNVWLPRGAELTLTDAQQRITRGPYTDQHNRQDRELWIPLVPGERAVLRLIVPDAVKHAVSINLDQINRGYRSFTDMAAGTTRSASCNVDVACPEADDHADSVRSVAFMFVARTGAICSGSLINNTAEDGIPYFLTANHCGVTEDNQASTQFYFNYQSSSCRLSGSASNGSPVFIGDFTDTLTGATITATNPDSDFLLLRLNQAPPKAYAAFYAGWDRRAEAPTSAYTIHHPSGHGKRISIESDPVEFGLDPLPSNLEAGTYWIVPQWDIGITQDGSSGGPLFNQNDRITGQLNSGTHFVCPGAEEGPDYYGRFDVSWDSGETPETRLSDWLDPLDSGVLTLDGSEGCPDISASILQDGFSSEAGELFEFRASVNGTNGPFTYAWDIDGDGQIDSRQATVEVRYPRASAHTVSLSVLDAASCPAEAQLGLVVNGSQITVASDNGQPITPSDPVELCGDGDASIEPNETWRFPFSVTNLGTAALNDGYAAVRIHPDSPTNNAPDSTDSAYTSLESGALLLGDLAVNQSTEIELIAHIGSDFSCGGELAIDYLGTGFASGFYATTSDRFMVVPVGVEDCNSNNSSCPLNTFAPIDFQPQRGFWFNPLRSGNGEEIHVVNQQMYSIWYTGRDTRLPIWYYQQSLSNARYRNNQIDFDLLRFTLNGNQGGGTLPFFDDIGDARYAFIDPETVLKTWDIRGDRFGELLQFFNLSDVPVDAVTTDQYFNPEEAGWGVGYQRQGLLDFVALYFYNDQGLPTWMVNRSPGQLQAEGNDRVLQVRTHCPGCAWLPAEIISDTATVSFEPQMDHGFLFGSQILIEGVEPVIWLRDQLPLQAISPNH